MFCELNLGNHILKQNHKMNLSLVYSLFPKLLSHKDKSPI